MENLALKIRISVLWLFTEVAMLAYIVVWLIEPGVIEGIIAGEMLGMQIGPELLLLIAIILLVLLVMAVLSLTLKDSTNRRANIVMGIVFTGLRLIELIEHLADPTAHGILMIISTVVAPALIAWYAWKWPKQGV